MRETDLRMAPMHGQPGPPPPFFVSVHSKENKVVYFYGFTEVFILKGLTGRFCTKIVQQS